MFLLIVGLSFTAVATTQEEATQVDPIIISADDFPKQEEEPDQTAAAANSSDPVEQVTTAHAEEPSENFTEAASTEFLSENKISDTAIDPTPETDSSEDQSGDNTLSTSVENLTEIQSSNELSTATQKSQESLETTTDEIHNQTLISHEDTPTPSPSPLPTENPATPSPTPEPTQEPTPEATPEPTQEPTPNPTQEPTPNPTQEPTREPTPEATPNPTPEATPNVEPPTATKVIPPPTKSEQARPRTVPVIRNEQKGNEQQNPDPITDDQSSFGSFLGVVVAVGIAAAIAYGLYSTFSKPQADPEERVPFNYSMQSKKEQDDMEKLGFSRL